MEKPVGLTKDVGWQFGLRKTFHYPQQQLWDFMFSEKGLSIWLGTLQEAKLKEGDTYKSREGTEGSVKVFKPYSHIRITWKKKDWENISTVQVRVMGNEKKATISFHQEKLLNSEQREEMKLYWNDKMDKIKNVLSSR